MITEYVAPYNTIRQHFYVRLAGYEDVNDSQRLSVDLVIRAITGKNDKALDTAHN